MRLLIAAGEASGDQLGAALVRQLAGPDLDAFGLAGPRMRAAGVRAVRRSEQATALGLAEVVGSLPRLRGVLADLESALDPAPDVVLTIDSPGLLLRLGRAAKRRGIPVVHWVSPQLWAWRPGRVHQMSRAMDAVLCLLPFEPALYDGSGVQAVFCGHPAAARRAPPIAPRGAPLVLLAPGSRPAELRRLWPLFRQAAGALWRRHPGARFVVARAPGVSDLELAGLDAVICDDLPAAAAAADIALVASGTATLELAVAGTPMVVAYAVHPATWALGRRLVRGVRWLALPNVLAGAPIVPEHLQQISPEAVAHDLSRLLGPDGVRQREALARVVARLHGAGAVARAAGELRRWARR